MSDAQFGSNLEEAPAHISVASPYLQSILADTQTKTHQWKKSLTTSKDRACHLIRPSKAIQKITRNENKVMHKMKYNFYKQKYIFDATSLRKAARSHVPVGFR